MTLKDLQNEVDKWVGQYATGYWPPHQQITCMAEEVGEVAREINHLHGIKKRKPGEQEGSLGKELSDVVFTAVCIANRHGIDLQQEWDKMMQEKLYGRDKDRYEKK
jgi:NTP pyrophosphatase (non-canonical NTP hydrolase)